MNTTLVRALPVLALISCCSCSGEEDGVQQGRFVDSPVQGLAFASGQQSGLTDADGGFSYEPKSPVSFSIGDIEIGQAAGAAVITPLELVQGSDETNNIVTNIARLLQSLDADRTAQNAVGGAHLANGISIPQVAHDLAAGKTIDFDQTPDAFGQDPAVLGLLQGLPNKPPLQSPSAAQAALRDALLALMEGTWSGSFSGAESGSWKVTVTRAGDKGVISGDGVTNGGEPFGISGSLTASGSADFETASGGAGGATFTGVFSRDASGAGTWAFISIPGAGTWQGKREGPAPQPEKPTKPFGVTHKSNDKCVFQTLDNAVACRRPDLSLDAPAPSGF